MDPSSQQLHYGGAAAQSDASYVFQQPDGIAPPHSYHPDTASLGLHGNMAVDISSAEKLAAVPALLDAPGGSLMMPPAITRNISSFQLPRPLLGFDHAGAEAPGLSSGSSATPETRASSQQITPNMPPSMPPARPLLPLPRLEPSRRESGAQPAPVKGKRGRRPKPKSDDPAVEEAKRDRFLQRNRVAATKCRQKRKEWMSDLEETKEGLESQNSHLHIEYSSLLNEVTQLRAQLMSHSGCSDARIDKWIENEAKRYVINEGERFDQMLANFGQMPVPGRPSVSMSAYPPSELVSPTSQTGGIPPLPPVTSQPTSPVIFRGFAPLETIPRTQPSSDVGYNTIVSPTTMKMEAPGELNPQTRVPLPRMPGQPSY